MDLFWVDLSLLETTVLRLLRLPGGARHFEAVGQVKAVACQNGHAAVGPACSEAQCFIQKFKAQKFLLHSPAMG